MAADGPITEHGARLFSDLVRKLVAAPRRGGVRLTQDEARLVVALMRERDDIGPFFVRDCARLVGLPDVAAMDDIMARLRAATLADHPLRVRPGEHGYVDHLTDAERFVYTNDLDALEGLITEGLPPEEMQAAAWVLVQRVRGLQGDLMRLQRGIVEGRSA